MLSILDCLFHTIIGCIGYIVQPMISFLIPMGLAIFGIGVLKYTLMRW